MKRMASPVWSTTPMTMPAAAVAIATGTVCSAPSRSASIPFRSVMRLSGRIQDSTITDAAEIIAA